MSYHFVRVFYVYFGGKKKKKEKKYNMNQTTNKRPPPIAFTETIHLYYILCIMNTAADRKRSRVYYITHKN